MNSYKKIYFCGIGGIGVSALAKLYLSQGAQVLGSDLVKSEITQELENLGIKINYLQQAKNITNDIDFLVYSPAVPQDNLERQKAESLGIEQKSYPQVLGDFSKLYKTIAITGTNGKSTTTAMIAKILIAAKFDPMVVLGSQFTDVKGNFRNGQGDYFVMEACEYKAHMLNITPRAIVLTNIEEEHLDFYRDIDHIRDTFQKFIDKLDHLKKGILVINKDDLNSVQLGLPDCLVVTYAINAEAQVRASNIKIKNNQQVFEVCYQGQPLGEFELQIPGQFNIYNALAAISLALALKIKPEIIKKALAEFAGVWRRFEKIFNKDITVICDYAHHPTAIAGTIQAAKDFYPEKRLVAVFQPHQHSRTKKLFNDFSDSLSSADMIILSEIYDVTGREEKEDQDISSKDLVKQIKKKWPDKKVLYAKDLNQTLDLVNFNIKPGDVALVMGAGDIYKICDKIHI